MTISERNYNIEFLFKYTLLLLFLVLQVDLLKSQPAEFKQIENELITNFKNFQNADFFTREAIRPKLKPIIEKTLSDPNSFEYDFDSLSNYIKIIKSDDNMMKIFSWDELSGGSANDMAIIIQYKAEDVVVRTEWIDRDYGTNSKGISNSIQYEIHSIKINGKPYYLCFGWGTMDGGKHHNSLMILSIYNDSIKYCRDCIDKNYSIIPAQRGDKIDLRFDKRENIITFNEFTYNYDLDYFNPTGKIVKLKLINGKYVNITDKK